jgi:hypothetical protein
MAATVEEQDELVPELGDRVTILSDVHKRTTGRIIFRDGSLIRIRPDTRATVAIDFPLDPTTQLFRADLGVNEVQIHEKRATPSFAAQLTVFPDDQLLFYSTTGDVIGEPGIVDQVIATETQDAIVLRDGRVLDFGFVGPQEPLAILLPYEPVEEEASNTESVGSAETGKSGESQRIPAWEAELAAIGIEEEPQDTRTYDDVAQREAMFLSLLQSMSFKQQKNPVVLSNLYRETDLLTALKNSIVVRDADQAIVPGRSRSYVARTLRDVVAKDPAPISSLVPVAAVKKVLYSDTPGEEDHTDVLLVNDMDSLFQSLRAANAYSEETGQNGFAAYLHAVSASHRVFVPSERETPGSVSRTRFDQDVFRTKIPGALMEGFRPNKDMRGGYVLVFGQRKEMITFQRTALTSFHNLPELTRVLTGSYAADPNTGIPFTVAEADTDATVAHVLLSKSLARLRIPARSSVLLWDIMASEMMRAQRVPFAKLYNQHADQQRVITAEDDVRVTDLLKERVRTSVSFMDRDLVATLDSLGLRSLELTNSMLAAFQVEAAQQTWRASDERRKQRAAAVAGTASACPLGAPVAAESPLLAAEVLTAESLKEAMRPGQEPFQTVAALSEGVGKTLLPLWMAIANSAPTAVLEPLQAAAEAESRRQALALETARAKEAAMTSKPKYNPCKHVVDIQRIRNIRDTHKRTDLLETYIQTTGSGQAGHWVLCGLCKLPLVCKHEVLMIQEVRHPGRGQVLHKTLILEYASPHVFEGSYICKYCGQPIQRLEYDTSLEFDDDGVPLSGRAVLEEPEDEDGGEDDTNVLALMERGTQFAGSDKVLYNISRSILERCGMPGTEAMYEGIIKAANDYLRERVPDETYYNGRRAAALKAAEEAKRLHSEGKKVVPVKIPPEYRKYVANFQVAVIGALALFELQTTVSTIPFPAPGCVFSREGFPLDGDNPDEKGKGALTYVGCVVAGIYRSDMPWKATSWHGEQDVSKRRIAVIGAIQAAALTLLGLPALPPLTTVTDTYKERFAKKREDRSSATSSEVLPSRADVLPASFRPLPFQKSIATEAVGSEEGFLRNVETRPYEEVERFVGKRGKALAHAVLSEFNAVASRSVPLFTMRSEGTCCPTSLQEAAEIGLGVSSLRDLPTPLKRELAVLGGAGLEKRDVAAAANGTHIVVPWSAPLQRPQLPALQPDLYYKLFLKKCAKGRRTGFTHEYNDVPAAGHIGSTCRHCGFALPSEMRYLSFSEISDSVLKDGEVKKVKDKDIEARLAEQDDQRKALALAAFEAQGVVINDVTFKALEAAVKRRALLAPAPPLRERDVLTRLSALEPTLAAVLLPDARATWTTLLETLATIRERRLPVGIQRAQEWAKVSGPTDATFRRVEARFLELKEEAAEHAVFETINGFSREVREEPLKSHDVASLLERLIGIAKDPVLGAHTLQHYLVVVGQQTLIIQPLEGVSLAEFSAKQLPHQKWFPRINQNHLSILRKIWKQGDLLIRPFGAYLSTNATASKPQGRRRRGAAAAATAPAAAAAGQEAPEGGRRNEPGVAERMALDRAISWLGPVLSEFVHEFRPSNLATEKELSTILCFVCSSIIESLMDPSSPLYADVDSITKKEDAALFFALYYNDVLYAAEAFSDRYQRSADEIRQTLRIREEIEKSIFTRRFETIDKSQHDIEIVKKQLKLGDWAQGQLENLVNYKSSTVAFQLGQIREMGIDDFGVHIGGEAPRAETAAERTGFRTLDPTTAAEGGYQNRVAMDED